MLSVCFGGLGLRSANDLAIQAYLSSHESCRCLASTILPPPAEPSTENANDINTTWTSSCLKIPDDSVGQSNCYSMLCSDQVATLKPILEQYRQACFVAATCQELDKTVSPAPLSDANLTITVFILPSQPASDFAFAHLIAADAVPK